VVTNVAACLPTFGNSLRKIGQPATVGPFCSPEESRKPRTHFSEMVLLEPGQGGHCRYSMARPQVTHERTASICGG